MTDDEIAARDAAFAKTEGGSWDEVFDAGRNSVTFPPLSEFRDKFREMICEGDFDFTKIFEEIEFEGEKYTDISNEGADALADYFISLFEMIDQYRSEQVGWGDENYSQYDSSVTDMNDFAEREKAKKSLPTIEEMSGLVPDFTAGKSLKDYMAELSDE